MSALKKSIYNRDIKFHLFSGFEYTQMFNKYLLNWTALPFKTYPHK